MTLPFADLDRLTGGRTGIKDAPCPLCAPLHNPKRKVLRLWRAEPAFVTYHCARCTASGWAAENSNNRHARPYPERLAALKREAAEREAHERARKLAQALTLWGETLYPHGTPVEQHLAHRGLELPSEGAGEAIRFHSSCPFAGERVPTMVALVRDVVSNQPKAVHRTALNYHGRKIEVDGKDRLALGPIGGGAVKVSPDEDVTTCLGIGEGIETSLSLRLVSEFGPSPVWSLLSAGGIEHFPVLPGIECLWIAVDHDPAGLKAARACAARWQAAGREVFLITPSAPRADLNDLIKGANYAQP